MAQDGSREIPDCFSYEYEQIGIRELQTKYDSAS